MSVKGKIKRLNKEILELKDELETINLSNSRLRAKLDNRTADPEYAKELENIVKFAITNHVGGLRAGMQIDRCGIDKMQDLRLNIDYEPMYNAYVIRVNY